MASEDTVDETATALARARPEADRATAAALARVRAALVDRKSDGATLGRFHIESRIGRGGMGVVYGAHDPTLDRSIALKVVTIVEAHDRERVLDEARSQARVAHPNVVAIFDVQDHGDVVAIAMERVDGDLRRWLKDAPRAWSAVAGVFLAVGRGLAAAHQSGLVHGDVKPENVLIGSDGRPRVADFGLARLMRGDGADDGEGDGDGQGTGAPAAATHAAGTPPYMAPELLAGGVATPSSDQFAFAVSLFEALCGERPFRGRDVRELAAAMRTPPVPPRRLPVALGRLLVRALSPGPDQRFPSMAAVADELERILRRGRRRIAIAIACVAAGAAIALLGARAWRPAPVSEPEDCRASQDAFAEIRNPARVAAVEQAFRRSGRSFAKAVAGPATRALTDYGERWTALAHASCAAVRAGVESRALFDLRSDCLRRGLDSAATLADSWSHATAEVVDRAQRSPGMLPSLATCADPVRLRARAPRPTDPVLAAAVATVEKRVQELTLGQRAGHAAKDLPEMRALVATSERLGFAPLIADARAALGHLQADVLDPAAANTFEAALAAAGEAHDDEAFTAAGLDLLGIRLVIEPRPEVASSLAAIVGPMVERAGTPYDVATYQFLQAHIEALKGNKAGCLAAANKALAVWRSPPEDTLNVVRAMEVAARCTPDADSAIRLLDEADALLIKAFGVDHPDHVELVERRAHQIGERDGPPAAEPGLRQAVELAIQAYGHEHVLVAQVEQDLGGNLAKQGRFAEADALLRGVVERLRPDQVGLPAALNTLGQVELGLGHFDQAIAAHEEAIRGFERHGLHLSVGNAINALGNALRGAGRLDEARAAYLRALAAWEEAGADHAQIAVARSNLGEMALAAGRFAEAEDHCRRALAIDEERLTASNPDLAYDLTCIGQALTGRGDDAAALPILERALALRSHGGIGDLELGQVHLALARALWSLRPERERARQLATAAAREFRRAHAAAELSAATAWLAAPR